MGATVLKSALFVDHTIYKHTCIASIYMSGELLVRCIYDRIIPDILMYSDKYHTVAIYYSTSMAPALVSCKSMPLI